MSAPAWEPHEVAAVVADIEAGGAYLQGGATSDGGWSLRFVPSGESGGPGESAAGIFLLSEWDEVTDEVTVISAEEAAAIVRRSPRHAVRAIPATG